MDIPVRYLPENYSMRDTLQDNPSAGRRSKRFFSTRFSASFCQPPLPPTNDKKKREERASLSVTCGVRSADSSNAKVQNRSYQINSVDFCFVDSRKVFSPSIF